MTKICVVAAVAQDHCIGKDNTLPWKLPEDLKHFKELTMGAPLVMGRRTFESIGKPLPGRQNIIITRNLAYAPDGAVISNTLWGGIRAAQTFANLQGKNVYVIGGGEIYREVLPLADELIITHVHTRVVGGDAFFPLIESSIWETYQRGVVQTSREGLEYRIARYRKRA